MECLTYRRATRLVLRAPQTIRWGGSCARRLHLALSRHLDDEELARVIVSGLAASQLVRAGIGEGPREGPALPRCDALDHRHLVSDHEWLVRCAKALDHKLVGDGAFIGHD